jgi:sporulation protein YlmC with PRC-barrel domain
MTRLTAFGTGTACTAAILLASGMALAQPQQQYQQGPEQRPQQQQPQQQQPQRQQQQQPEQQQQQQRQSDRSPVDDADPMLDDPAVETGDFEDGMVPDGQHADHLHWSVGTAPHDRFHADELIGSEVRNRDDDPVGQVTDLVLDREGRILAIVVETGGELGLGGRTVAVPWDTAQPVRIGDREFYVVVESGQDGLLHEPEYER